MENFGGALEAFSKASSFCWSVSWIDIDGESAGSSGGLLDYYQGVVEDKPCAQLSLHLYAGFKRCSNVERKLAWSLTQVFHFDPSSDHESQKCQGLISYSQLLASKIDGWFQLENRLASHARWQPEKCGRTS